MKYFLISLFLIPFLVLSQDLPDSYSFFNNGQQLVRGGEDINNGLYSEIDIDTVFLYFDQVDYWAQLQDNYCDKINIAATMIYKNEEFLDVGVRFKGQTSYFNTNGDNGGGPGGGPGGNSVDTDKKSFNIELDWINNQDINGYETLNLNNCYQDPSFLREFIFEKLSRNYIPALKVNFVQLMINDQNWGIYPNVQQLDKKHAGEWFFNDECTRWRAEDPSSEAPGCGEPSGGGPGGGPGGGGPNFGAGVSSLNYLGEDTVNYLEHYSLKKSYVEDPWVNLVNACEVVDQVNAVDPSDVYSFVNEHLDLDATLWHLADEIIFSDDDSYINKGGMDYYVYYDIQNERILPIEYDGNTVFGNTNWSPFYHEEDTDFALLNKLLSIPDFRQRYLAHFRTILRNSFNEDYIESLIDEYANMIDSYVFDDPQKIYTYNDFVDEVNDLKDYFTARSNYLWSNNEVSEEGVDILNVEYSVGNNTFAQPNSSDEVVVSVELDADDPLNVNLYYGTGLTGRFEAVEMQYSFATGKYTYNILPQNGGEYVRFYIESIDEDGVRVYSPEGAEHNVYIYQVKTDDLVYVESDIVINEIMAANDMTVADEFGEFDDWIELYNKGNQSVNLDGFHLSDDPLELEKYTFPNVVLGVDEYLIIWADDDEEDQGEYHATFKLSSSGEELYLSDENFDILDGFSFEEQQDDMGYARVPNGLGEFMIQYPTFSSNNDNISGNVELLDMDKNIIKTLDFLGREIRVRSGLVFDVYDNGTCKKYFIIN